MKFKINSQEGTSLYFAILLIAILLAIVLAFGTLSFFQIKTIRGMGNSVVAFYAAETGIERELYEKNDLGSPPYSGDLGGGITYQVRILGPGEEGCPLDSSFCIDSVGTYQAVRRALRVSR